MVSKTELHAISQQNHEWHANGAPCAPLGRPPPSSSSIPLSLFACPIRLTSSFCRSRLSRSSKAFKQIFHRIAYSIFPMSSKRRSRRLVSQDASPVGLNNGNGNGFEDQDDDSDERNAATSLSQSSKRPRIRNGTRPESRLSTLSQTVAHSPSNQADIAALDTNFQSPSANDSSSTLKRDLDGFLPGSIVRVALKNFVTYGSVEMFPGPHLNMIIGPNGTGKSTWVCAIALGLGFSVNTLERAPELKLFIKTGEQEGSVEIELKGKPKKKNVIIKLYLSLASNSRVFEVNGEKATAARVQEIVRSFNIQVDNLCCFLPQEKVSKFAAMKEPELLKETQKVAGHPLLNQWHNSLISHGKEKIVLDNQFEGVQKSYHDIEVQVNNMKRDVDRLEDRRKIENKIQAYELCLEQNKYSKEKASYQRAKLQVAETKERVAQLESESEPLKQQKKIFEQLSEKYEACRGKIQSTSARCQQELARSEQRVKDAATKFEITFEQLTTLTEEERRHKDRLVQLTREVEDLGEKIKQPIEEPDVTPFNEKLQTLSARIRQIQGEIENLQSRQKDIYEERRRLLDQQHDINQEIQNLQSVSGRKEADLRSHLPKVFQALQIMRQLKQEGKFSGKVFEPLRLLVTPKEPRFARAIEGCVTNDLLNTFLFTDPNDYELMAHECNDNRQLRINLACMRAGDSMAHYQSPLSLDEQRAMGFDDLVINLIDAPDEVLAFICQQSRLHMMLVAHDERAQVDESRLKDKTFPIKSWILGTTRFNINFSAYGAKEIVIKSFELSMPRILNIVGVDNQAVQAKKDALENLRSISIEKEAALARLTAEETALRHEHEQIRNQKKEVDNAWKEIRKPHVEYLKDVATHKAKNNSLKTEKAKQSFDQEKKKRKEALREVTRQHAEVVTNYKNVFFKLSHLSTALLTLNLRILHHQADQKAFESIYRDKTANLSEAKTLFQEEALKAKEIFKNASEMINELQKASSAASDQVNQRMSHISAQLSEERKAQENQGVDEEEILDSQRQWLQNVLNEEQMSLEVAHPVDPSIMDRYKRLSTQMTQDKHELDKLQVERNNCITKIQQIHDLWKPHLDKLIASIDEKFDAAFKRMGCLGHVVVAEDPDYDKWGIEIQVSFRDNEPLVRLDPHRQSGGERSLSTIMYFMSLTELAKSPFSLVDEINQGMDRRAERLVHDQLVEITCRQSASQYFLVTPKLLFGLRYHPLMRILCVNNGDWLPEGFKLRPWLEKAKRQKTNRAL
ncbi:hypothetical protein O181_016193 [Austropuccinia psidii MF-1]|uniref:Structural maintenance of chromosomes protein 5 n=1 Tax=Austropuccinia psidii MF-1 TaxID=1389203 RepID=A0A9Q3C3W1_9BASI|nr:hypothetical protein [Austropuccinia psidii MF-1]